MHTIDCFGDVCPIPLLKIEKELKKTKDGDAFMVVVDHSCVLESIHDHYDNSAHNIESEEVMNGVWEIIITKHNSK